MVPIWAETVTFLYWNIVPSSLKISKWQALEEGRSRQKHLGEAKLSPSLLCSDFLSQKFSFHCLSYLLNNIQTSSSLINMAMRIILPYLWQGITNPKLEIWNRTNFFVGLRCLDSNILENIIIIITNHFKSTAGWKLFSTYSFSVWCFCFPSYSGNSIIPFDFLSALTYTILLFWLSIFCSSHY